MPDPTETMLTDNPVCPHCGYEHEAAWEWELNGGNGDTVQCESCERDFFCERVVVIQYTTSKPKEAK